MHSRRRFVRVTSAVAGTGLLAALSGCLGDDGEEDYEEAIDLLEENAASLDEFADRQTVPDDFNDGRIHRRVDSADDHLDAAADDADDELMELIENARAVGEYQRELATYNVLTVELDRCFDGVVAQSDAERFDDARNRFNDCQNTFRELGDALDDVLDAHDEIDRDLLADEGQLEHDDVEDELQYEETSIAVLEDFLHGIDQFLEGASTMMDGVDELERERWGPAEDDFRQASDAFAESEDTMAGIEADPELPDEFEVDVIEFRCFADAMEEGTAHIADAAAALERGDESAADDHLREAEIAFERCE